MELYKIINSFCRNYPGIESHALKTLLMSDPTFKQTYRGSFTGRYGVWIGRMYASGSIKPGDIPELKAALATYDKNKIRLPQIKDCKSLSELIGWVRGLSDDFKVVRKQSDAKENLEDDEWTVYVPHSHAAARRGGEGTRWCTASENDYYYNMYSNQGSLYINVRKSDGAKYQFHFETDQFMDANDDPIGLNKIGLSDGLAEFYTKANPLFKYLMKYDFVDEFINGFATVVLNTKYNFIDGDGNLLSQQWFDYVGDFSYGFAEVKLNGKHNFINAKGQFLSQLWFDMAWDFNDGFAIVRLNENYNFINTKGQLLSQQWFDNVWNFKEGSAKVKLNGKYNFINAKGQFLSQQWFDWVGNFNEGFTKVGLNGQDNLINTEWQICGCYGKIIPMEEYYLWRG